MILLHGTWVLERDCRAFLYGYFGSKEHIPLLRQGKNVRFFLNTVCTKLGLENTFVSRGRAENFMQGKKARLIVSRAFMPYDKMLPFIAPYFDLNPRSGKFCKRFRYFPEFGTNSCRTLQFFGI